jgi:hypothetical protein
LWRARRDDLAEKAAVICDLSGIGWRRDSKTSAHFAKRYIVFVVKRYSIAEARPQLPAIIDQAESGLEIELTRRG